MNNQKFEKFGWFAFVGIALLLSLALGVDTMLSRHARERPRPTQADRTVVQEPDRQEDQTLIGAAHAAPIRARSAAPSAEDKEPEQANPAEPGSNEAIVIETLESSFGADAAPDRLAGDRELVIQNAFRAEGLSNLTDGLSSLSCRASLCRGEVFVRNGEADRELFNKIVVQGPLLNDLPGSTFTIARREPLADGSLRVVFFVHPPGVLTALNGTL
jgi:hypothetical protein